MIAALRREVARSAAAVRVACHMALTKAGLVLAAGVAALAGSGFLLAAAYGALGRALGYPSAGLIMGTALLAVAAGLCFAARRIGPRPQPAAEVEADVTISLTAPLTAAPSVPVDLAPMAAFTAAFVLARRISQAP